jgi:hypothetical protein
MLKNGQVGIVSNCFRCQSEYTILITGCVIGTSLISHNSPLRMSELPCGHYYSELGKSCNVARLILTETLYPAGVLVPPFM